MADQYTYFNFYRIGNVLVGAQTLVSTAANTLIFRYRVPHGMIVQPSSVDIWTDNATTITPWLTHWNPEVADNARTPTELRTYVTQGSVPTNAYTNLDLSAVSDNIQWGPRSVFEVTALMTAGSKTVQCHVMLFIIEEPKESEFVK